MRSLLFATILLVCFQTTNAQSFSKAKITTKANEIIDCFIKNSIYEGTPQNFSYALSIDGPIISIHGDDIMKIEFEDGAIYERHFIKVPVILYNYLERNEEQYKVESNYVKGYRLVEKLISGPVALYQFIDSFQFSHFFYYTSSDSEIVLLPYKPYVENSSVHEDYSYKNFLIFLSQSNQCDKTTLLQIERSKYDFNNMIHLFKEINRCAGQVVELNNPMYKKGEHFRFGLMGGLSSTSLHFAADVSYYPGLTDDKFPNSIMPLFGIFVDVLPAKKIKNYLLSLELYYHMYNSETDSIKINSYTSSVGFVKFSTININPLVRFFLSNSQKAKPFLEGSANVSIIVSKEDHYDSYSSGQKSSFPIFKNKGTDALLGAGAGMDFSRFSLNLRYQFSLTHANGYFNCLAACAKLNFVK